MQYLVVIKNNLIAIYWKSLSYGRDCQPWGTNEYRSNIGVNLINPNTYSSISPKGQRKLLCSTFCYEIKSEMRIYIPKRTKVTDVCQTFAKRKWQRTRHFTRRTNDRCGHKVLKWRLRTGRRSMKSRSTTWTYNQVKVACSALYKWGWNANKEWAWPNWMYL